MNMPIYKKGFTLAELLIVVAIIAVLVGISIPVFTNQLEKSRESKDLANVRSAYAEVMLSYMTGESENVEHDETNGYFLEVPLSQNVYDWQSSNDLTVGGISSTDQEHWKGIPGKNGKCLVSIKEDELLPTLYWSQENSTGESISNYKKQLVQDSAKECEDALNNVLNVLYDELVSPKLGKDFGQIAYIQFNSGKITAVTIYGEKDKPDKPGRTAYANINGATEELRTAIDFDDINSKISEALKDTGFRISGTDRIFFDKEGNVISNTKPDGSYIGLGGQGAASNMELYKGSTKYALKFSNDNEGWYK